MADNPTKNFFELVLAAPLSEVEKELRDRFVTQYLIDFDAWAAALRIGLVKTVAGQYAQDFMEDPYVRQQISERQHAIATDPLEAEKANKRRVEAALMKEAHYKGPGSTHGARVQALAKLATIYDMDAPIKMKSDVLHRGGVMVIPAMAGVEDWQKAALSSQAKLQSEAKH